MVETFDDCLYLLDGRLKQLTAFNVNVYSIESSSTIVHDVDTLPNLKCFSLKSYFRFQQYDLIPSLLRCMPYLEHLTLYIVQEFISSTYPTNIDKYRITKYGHYHQLS
ncbi:unnamed protein product [Rotaria magnacalcarata]|uniref:Uncharacterized protein n=1 Tax=Rotaria magnacalcarata TaxID=392030 RepID=A0A8S2NVP7_9BILA|nr:unnamed protein product [Rotaria magnacalcarata]CAF4028918.1 unnamed protein product [Rotaria magnacalcarata]CAF4055101.1 unnamed protein product [Rotaria magnacalcarata]